MRNAIGVGGETLAEDPLLEGGFEDVERYHVRCRSKPGLFLTFSAGLAVFPGIPAFDDGQSPVSVWGKHQGRDFGSPQQAGFWVWLGAIDDP